ncbi:MAG: hypothetical protein DMG39_27030 [Acidobacteria bacterium]|nr:MAG: hypothetical protein DMG39_27030 [Acidobacteriota bacterium]
MASNPRNESSQYTGGAGQALSPVQERNHRKSDRVFLTLPIRVSGVRGQGKDFSEEGQTIDISRQGATIKVDRDLFAGEIIKIERLDGVGKKATARVVGRIAGGPEGYVFGVTMLDAAIVNPLGVVFPTVVGMHKAVLRALLRCVVCDRTEVSYLNEFEADLFLHHHYISRICENCGGWTTWNRPHGRRSTGSAAVPPGTQNRRSHDRIQVEAVGCVRHPARGNEVVVVRELALGGLSFYSATQYPEGSRVEIAVPYSSKAPNIYAPARIVSSRNRAGEGLLEYECGAVYLE